MARSPDRYKSNLAIETSALSLFKVAVRLGLFNKVTSWDIYRKFCDRFIWMPGER